MPVRSFAADAAAATTTSRPVPRGIAFRFAPLDGSTPTLDAVKTAAGTSLDGWDIGEVSGLPGWYEAVAPAAPAMPLGAFWETLRQFRKVRGVSSAEPLLLIANPDAPTAIGFGQDRLGLWGSPYDDETLRRIGATAKSSDWHLAQLRVPEAWGVWRRKHPNRPPGDGVLVGHPDTGFSDHVALSGRLRTPGRSFLEDEEGNDEVEARDDLRLVGSGVLQFPGHGTATASVIAGGERDQTGSEEREVSGVAPGASVLPLRVSRSVAHFDFRNVGRAILQAVEDDADVISMSLGGPGYSGFVRESIRAAHDRGVIVVAAAGNFVPTTVFPAAFPEVVAVAATHAAEAPWRYSGLGRGVDIAAPGEEVWCARASRDGRSPKFTVGQGTGTSFAAACVAGLAALWLSFHGGREAIAQEKYGGRKELVPFAFHYLLARTANTTFPFVRRGRHGAGIADAAKLLEADVPELTEVERFREVVRQQSVHTLSLVSGLLAGWLGVTDRPGVTLAAEATVAANGQPRTDAVEATEAVVRVVEERDAEALLLGRLLGKRADEVADELLARIAADRRLLLGCQGWRPGESLVPLFDRLLPDPAPAGAAPEAPTPELSTDLRDRLMARRQEEERRQQVLHGGRPVPGVSFVLPAGPPPPAVRPLRVYAFDPSQETSLATAPISTVTVPARWEQVAPGPVGEYLEVVDVDPASGCVYSPVDLNHPHVLAQDGLLPSEGSPQFHQQMVYAVAMNTINRFELALGRPVFWSPLRPWQPERRDERQYFTPEALALIERPLATGEPRQNNRWRDRYVQRLRIYPHALREANAYYSPQKRALLFGYFPGSDDDTGRHYPGGMVFTCLSHDIVVHETTHALLDGMHPYFNEPSNEDVWAFHEAFADIVALFQHFTYPEVLRHQIANTRGDLESDNLLAQLAQQFGQAIGGRGALRNALGDETPEGWKRRKPDPLALRGPREPHARGSILVAAVFGAFLALYNDRVADLLRLASGGTGVLPLGRIHPDLVNRLASEATETAKEVLRVCIRAMDYVPPVDITFGEFLRALITADYDLAPTERRHNRIAFIEAFRSWGIYPRDVSTLSEESLRWRRPGGDEPLTRLAVETLDARDRAPLERLLPELEAWQPRADRGDLPWGARGDMFERILEAQAVLNKLLKEMQARLPGGRSLLPGIDLRRGAHCSVGNLRLARRIGEQGEFRTEMVVEVVQTYRPDDTERDGIPFRGGATLIADLRTWDVRYVIYKRVYEDLPNPNRPEGTPAARFDRQERFETLQVTGAVGEAHAVWRGEDGDDPSAALVATYTSARPDGARRLRQIWDEPFALIHRTLD